MTKLLGTILDGERRPEGQGAGTAPCTKLLGTILDGERRPGGQGAGTAPGKKHFAVWLLVAGLLVWVGLTIGGAAATGRSTTAPVTDPRLDMGAALQAIGPHPSLGEQANVFGRFVGVWDGEYTEFSLDGKTTHSSGEWTFGWVMDGRAMEDLFIIHPSAVRKERYIGTTLRYFDPKSATWRVTFVDPEKGAVETLNGGAVGDDRIVLHSGSTDGKEFRWSFEAIHADSWVFRDEVSSDGGMTWRLREEGHMKRRGAAPRMPRALF